MNFKALALFFWVFLIAGAAIAGEEQRTRIEIAVDDDAMSSQSFVFDSEESGFDLDSMAVGETRTLTDSAGRTADIRRTDDGFELDVNGNAIHLPDLPVPGDMHGEQSIEILVDDVDSDVVVVNDIKKVKIIRSDSAADVTVISGKEIDAATRKRIREALEASGQYGDVQYIDGSELDDADLHAHGVHKVRIIRKEVDETN